jgi:hypothetical protein
MSRIRSARLYIDAARKRPARDALLQQNGCFVLRFLAQDLGKRLDYVLDIVFGALAHRQGHCYLSVPSSSSCSFLATTEDGMWRMLHPNSPNPITLIRSKETEAWIAGWLAGLKIPCG